MKLELKKKGRERMNRWENATEHITEKSRNAHSRTRHQSRFVKMKQFQCSGGEADRDVGFMCTHTNEKSHYFFH